MTFKKDWKAYLKASRIETQKAKKADKALAEYKKAKKRAASAWKKQNIWYDKIFQKKKGTRRK